MWQGRGVLTDATKNCKKTHFHTLETSFFKKKNLLESKYLNEINIFKNS